MRALIFLLICSFYLRLSSQSLYFPPVTGEIWATADPADLGWCPDRLDTLINFVEANHSKSFLILKDGRIAVERYFGTYTRDSLWYWASAGKSLAAFLVGTAQEDGYLNAGDPVSEHLGAGWTACTPEEEARITILHQLTMTTGFDDELDGPGWSNNCRDPACLQCLAEPGTRWAYHNAPYLLVHDVLKAATGLDLNIYTRLRVGTPMGMRGFWFDNVYYSRARDMARFGLLALNRGVWDGNAILADTAYFRRMTTPSQDLNPAYGYLWWLNGQDRYLLPGLRFPFPGPIIPAAPDDLFAALGKDDQKIYVVPSMGLVVVRQGRSAGGVRPGLSSFDNQLWERIMALECSPVAAGEAPLPSVIGIFPNPTSGRLQVTSPNLILQVSLWDNAGRKLREGKIDGADARLDLGEMAPGVYLLRIETRAGVEMRKVVKM